MRLSLQPSEASKKNIMKKNYTNSEICRSWANDKTLITGQTTTGNIFFNNREGKRIIYSYGNHYWLAEFITEDAVIINNTGYSNTTSKHISLIVGATSHLKQFFHTETDLPRVLDTISQCKEKLTVARKPEIYLRIMFRAHNNLMDFYAFTRQLTKLKKSKSYKKIVKIVKSAKVEYKQYLEDLPAIEAARAEKAQKREAIR